MGTSTHPAEGGAAQGFAGLENRAVFPSFETSFTFYFFLLSLQFPSFFFLSGYISSVQSFFLFKRLKECGNDYYRNVLQKGFRSLIAQKVTSDRIGPLHIPVISSEGQKLCTSNVLALETIHEHQKLCTSNILQRRSIKQSKKHPGINFLFNYTLLSSSCKISLILSRGRENATIIIAFVTYYSDQRFGGSNWFFSSRYLRY